ncbi:hypothetical protein KQH54_04585 [bacterium]|nr:hypothetical protein [bacterium]MCB2180377.1 hypothetical protein [bacterium]
MGKNYWKFEKLVWAASGILAILPIVQILRIQSEASSSLIFGLSTSRLILVTGIILLGLVFGGMAIWGDRLEKRFPQIFKESARRRDFVFLGAMVFLWLGFAGSHNFERWQEFYIRIEPVIQYLGIVFALWMGYYVFAHRQTNDLPQPENRKEKRSFLPPFLIFGLFLSVWLFISLTGIGVTSGYPYWGEAGAIIFGYQFVLSLAVAFLLTFALNRLVQKRPQRFDTVAFIVLWVLAAALWNFADLGHNFFAPRAFGQPYLPYSDAALYDINAYSILIGKGLTFYSYTIRPLYISFLALLHFVSGPNYDILVALQVVVLALMVPGLYLLGRAIHSRTLGYLAAFLGLISQLNSIAANEFVRVSNVKLLLTETPTAVILVYVAYFFVSGLKGKVSQKKVVIAFGLLGLASLIRLHVMVTLVALVLMLFIISPKPKAQLRNAGSIALLTILVVLPWMFRNYMVRGIFSLDPGRFDYLMDTRWQADAEDVGGKHTVPTGLPKSQKLADPGTQAGISPLLLGANTLQEMLAHFLHNEVLSVVSLPQSLQFKTSTAYYQNEYFLTAEWAGGLSPQGKAFLAGNLLILSLGIWTTFKKHRWVGLVPLMIHLSYNGANALVRTSGWRYLIPTDWALLLYYGIGLIQILWAARGWMGQEKFNQNDHSPSPELFPAINVRTLFSTGIWFVLFSVLISFAPGLIPDQFPEVTPEKQQVYVQEIASQTDLSVEQIETFLSFEGAVLQVGKVLYPRFYYPDQGIFHYRSEVVDYPRVEFTLINYRSFRVREAIGYVENILSHEMDVVILGCSGEDNFIEVLLVYPLDDADREVMIRTPGWEPACPLATP